MYFIWVYHFRPFYLFYLFILDLFIYFIYFSLSYGAIHIQSINQLIILLTLYAWGYYSDYMYIHSLKINSFSFNTLTFFSFCIMPYLISGSNGQNSDLIYLNKRFEVGNQELRDLGIYADNFYNLSSLGWGILIHLVFCIRLENILGNIVLFCNMGCQKAHDGPPTVRTTSSLLWLLVLGLT